MAKALLGHLGGPDPVVLAEIARLRSRVRDLEDEVDRLHAVNDALTAVDRRGPGPHGDRPRARSHLTQPLDLVAASRRPA